MNLWNLRSYHKNEMLKLLYFDYSNCQNVLIYQIIPYYIFYQKPICIDLLFQTKAICFVPNEFCFPKTFTWTKTEKERSQLNKVDNFQPPCAHIKCPSILTKIYGLLKTNLDQNELSPNGTCIKDIQLRTTIGKLSHSPQRGKYQIKYNNNKYLHF